MRNKTNHRASILLALAICVCGIRVEASAQTTAEESAVHSRCSKVFLVSESPLLPQGLIGTTLQEREDFQASKLFLTEDERSADVVVRLRQGNEHGTSLLVVNRATGERLSDNSVWASNPGMAALDVMSGLRQVCPGSIVPPLAARRVAQEDRETVPALRTISEIAACSRTSWMDTHELSRALSSCDELKQWSIHITQGCEAARTRLEVTHNLEQTTEWTWALKSSDSATFTSGRVVAFGGRDAARRIVGGLVQEAGRGRGESTGPRTTVITEVARKGLPSRTVRVRFMPPDFSVFDTRTVLSIDSEKISARDVNGRLLFSFRTEQLRDVRHQRAWDPMFPLGAPTGLIARWDFAGNQLLELTSVQDDEVLANHVPEFAEYTTALLGYFGVGAIASPFKTPVEILELAWEQDGRVKTVSLQVPRRESGRLLHTLRDAICTDTNGVCGGTFESAAPKR